VILAALLWFLTFGGSTLLSQSSQDFTEQEIFTALHWGMPEPEARAQAHLLAGGLDKQLLNPNDSADVAESNFSEDLLVLLSLVSDEARVKAELRYHQMHGQADVREWETRRRKMRSALVRAGKLK